jgi:hypothetical protein
MNNIFPGNLKLIKKGCEDEFGSLSKSERLELMNVLSECIYNKKNYKYELIDLTNMLTKSFGKDCSHNQLLLLLRIRDFPYPLFNAIRMDINKIDEYVGQLQIDLISYLVNGNIDEAVSINNVIKYLKKISPRKQLIFLKFYCLDEDLTESKKEMCRLFSGIMYSTDCRIILSTLELICELYDFNGYSIDYKEYDSENDSSDENPENENYDDLFDVIKYLVRTVILHNKNINMFSLCEIRLYIIRLYIGYMSYSSTEECDNLIIENIISGLYTDEDIIESLDKFTFNIAYEYYPDICKYKPYILVMMEELYNDVCDIFVENSDNDDILNKLIKEGYYINKKHTE